ncbi:rna polymerase rpb7 domain containing partial [Nannochloropsis oceanica]
MPKRRRAHHTNGTSFTTTTSTSSSMLASSEPPPTPFQEQQVIFKLALLPHAMEDMEQHVRSKLHTLLMKYNEDAGGVLLAIYHIRQPPARRFATILHDLPFLHVQVEAMALVFTPTPGSVVTGEVIKVTGTHVALLVYGLFNAAIAREDMPDALEYVSGRGEWVCNGGEGRSEGRFALGEQVKFRVVRVHEAAGLLALDGSMREKGEEPRESVYGHHHYHHHHHQQQQQQQQQQQHEEGEEGEREGGGWRYGRQKEQRPQYEEDVREEEIQQQIGKRKAGGTHDQGEKKAKKQKKEKDDREGRGKETDKEKHKSKKKDKNRSRNVGGDSSD